MGYQRSWDIIDWFVVFRNYLNDLTYAKEFEYALVERTWALVPFIVLNIELHAQAAIGWAAARCVTCRWSNSNSRFKHAEPWKVPGLLVSLWIPATAEPVYKHYSNRMLTTSSLRKGARFCLCGLWKAFGLVS